MSDLYEWAVIEWHWKESWNCVGVYRDRAEAVKTAKGLTEKYKTGSITPCLPSGEEITYVGVHKVHDYATPGWQIKNKT